MLHHAPKRAKRKAASRSHLSTKNSGKAVDPLSPAESRLGDHDTQQATGSRSSHKPSRKEKNVLLANEPLSTPKPKPAKRTKSAREQSSPVGTKPGGATTLESTPRAASSAPFEWVELEGESTEGSKLGKTVAKNARPAVARLGMAVSHPWGGGGTGIIKVMTQDFCIAEFPDGKTESMTWFETQLQHVQPDPSQIADPVPELPAQASAGTLDAGTEGKNAMDAMLIRALEVGHAGPWSAQAIQLYLKIAAVRDTAWELHKQIPQGLAYGEMSSIGEDLDTGAQNALQFATDLLSREPLENSARAPEQPAHSLLASGDDDKDSLMELSNELGTYLHFMKQTCPSRHPTRSQFEFALKQHVDDYIAPRNKLVDLKGWFFSLPDEERRVLMNGWKVDIDWPSREEVMSEDVGSCVQRAMRISRIGDDMFSEFAGIMEDNYEPISIHIGVGITKHAAVKTLERIIDLVRSRWSEMIAGEPESWIENRSAGTWDKGK